MPAPKRLVLFVEGEGDEEAAPILVKRLLTEHAAWDALFLDEEPMRVGELGLLVRNDAAEWVRKLKFALKTRKSLGAVLLLVDGDLKHSRKKQEREGPFCAMKYAQLLAGKAPEAGAGSRFSAAAVICCQEYETWLLAGLPTLAGQSYPDGRNGVVAKPEVPPGDLEATPRDAKGWLRKQMIAGYKETTDQGPLTRLLVQELSTVRQRGLRSFRRLDEAVQELAAAVRSGIHVVTPTPPHR